MKDEHITKKMMARVKYAIHEFHRGNYRPSIELEMELTGITKTEAVANCKRSRVESKHQHWIAYGSSPLFYYPHCQCGWRGPEVTSYETAQKIKCPNRLRQLKNYRLEDK